MEIKPPKNPNYCATVVSLKAIVKLDNCDNVVATPLFGYQAIVGKEHVVGDLGIVLPPESRLSEEFCKSNNLFRHAEFNNDTSAKGYIEDNRRVKAMKFRGNRSDCLFMPIESLTFTGALIEELSEGDEFDELNGLPICEKYERPVPETRAQKAMKKAIKRIDKKFLPEHYDSENYFKNEHYIDDDTEIIVTQKLHGTSIRIGNTIVLRKLPLKDRIAGFLGVKIQETEFDYVYGSRKVIKNDLFPLRSGFYGEDIWSKEGLKLYGMLPQNFVVYGELVGWTEGGAPIQKDYTYFEPEGHAKLYVYRIAFVNAEGIITDLCWDQVKEFCKVRALHTVVELWRGKKSKFQPEKFLDKRFAETKELKKKQPVQLGSDQSLVDEGVCVRIDNMIPTIYKAKSPIFLQHETDLIDQGVADLEAEGSIAEAIEL